MRTVTHGPTLRAGRHHAQREPGYFLVDVLDACRRRLDAVDVAHRGACRDPILQHAAQVATHLMALIG